MEDNWFFNSGRGDDFNPDDHDIEMDEIAKIYAMADMKETQHKWLKDRAELFYKDFETLDVSASIMAIRTMINHNQTSISNVNTMLDNMISIFQDDEEYERCHFCLQIKNGLNDKI